MDSVQQFIANNSHQFGYIMHEAAKQWAEKCPTGALTVGPCKGTVDVYGEYHELLEKLEAMQKGTLKNHTIVPVNVTLDENNISLLAEEVYKRINNDLKTGTLGRLY
ncbi:hypothetical protein P4G82_25060 [Bacillus cereus]|nr:hypothetical protein [Bacillus cereus]